MAKPKSVEITVDQPLIDFEVKGSGRRHRYYALAAGEWMKCPTKSNLIFNGPSVVWYIEPTEPGITESCVEYDVNDRGFWNSLASAIEWRDNVVMHVPVDVNRRSKAP